MSRRFIHNYLRRYRKQSGLTQEEVAFLLGCQCGAKVSRYENLAREPSLATAFACQAIYRVPAHEIFPGIYTVVEKQVKRRAHVLGAKLDDDGNEVLYEQKEVFLDELQQGIEHEQRPELWENPKQLRLFSQ